MSQPDAVPESPSPTRRKLPGWVAPLVVFGITLLAIVPTVGDIGVTWDEPAYRYSQELSQEWWEHLFKARTKDDFTRLFDPATLLFYWPYGRFGINFHPPLAGQLNLLSYVIFGPWMKDIPARRMASVIEFAFTVMILYQFLAKRYGVWVGAIAGASLLLMPRLYGDAHIAGTDTPGLLIWGLAALAFWKGLYEPDARKWRLIVGILIGLAFIQKMATVMVVVPLVLWLIAGPLVRQIRSKQDRGAWIDGAITSTLMIVPLAITFLELQRISAVFVQMLRDQGIAPHLISVARMNLFTQHPETKLPSLILAVPLFVWIVRRILGRVLKSSPIWGVERPALETWTSILAFGPIISWLGNPEWWRETIPRLAHYYALNSGRRGALPDIRIIYFGQIYEYSLPWHNGWVWIGITVPVGILIASIVGLILRIPTFKRDRIPVYFGLHLLIWPFLRMLNTPAHDGIRLFLPTFFFIAAFAGWGVVGVSDWFSRSERARLIVRSVLSVVVLAPAVYAIVRIHPYELSYYSELIGGPRGAWEKGFEISYWYEAFDDRVLGELNEILPDGITIDTLNEATRPPTFPTLQELGVIKGSLQLDWYHTNRFPVAYMRKPVIHQGVARRTEWWLWMLAHDSKATALTRVAYVMTPIYELRPRQLDGIRLISVLSPPTVARTWALQLIADSPSDPTYRETPQAPAWARPHPWLARFWGDGLLRMRPLGVNEPLFAWARSNPASLRLAAQRLAFPPAGAEPDLEAERLRFIITHSGTADRLTGLDTMLSANPQALIDAIEIVITRGGDVRKILTHAGYLDPSQIGGPLDRDLPPNR